MTDSYRAMIEATTAGRPSPNRASTPASTPTPTASTALRRPAAAPAPLAPDLVKAILRGDEPNGISLEKLRQNLPVRWEEQRERWGRQLD